MRTRLTVVLAPLVVLTAACGGASPTADWRTGKDVLDGLKEAGFACEYSGSGEQVVMRSPLTGEEGDYPAVRCDGYGVVLVESRDALLQQLADLSQCEPISEEDVASEDAQMPLVLGDNFVVVPDGEFPGTAQPADFTKAFGGEEMTLLDLFTEACPDAANGDASSTGASPDPSEPETSGLAAEGAAPENGTVTVADQLVPGISAGTGRRTLVLWADPQAPAVAALHAANRTTLDKLTNEGAVTVVIRPATFLDRVNEGGDPATANSSTRAVAALGCAADQGRGWPYWNALMANQPEPEGDGWTDTQLTDLASEAGADPAALTDCVTSGRYVGWATSAGDAFQSSGLPGVPYAELDGVEVAIADLADGARLTDLVQ